MKQYQIEEKTRNESTKFNWDKKLEKLFKVHKSDIR